MKRMIGIFNKLFQNSIKRSADASKTITSPKKFNTDTAAELSESDKPCGYPVHPEYVRYMSKEDLFDAIKKMDSLTNNKDYVKIVEVSGIVLLSNHRVMTFKDCIEKIAKQLTGGTRESIGEYGYTKLAQAVVENTNVKALAVQTANYALANTICELTKSPPIVPDFYLSNPSIKQTHYVLHFIMNGKLNLDTGLKELFENLPSFYDQLKASKPSSEQYTALKEMIAIIILHGMESAATGYNRYNVPINKKYAAEVCGSMLDRIEQDLAQVDRETPEGIRQINIYPMVKHWLERSSSKFGLDLDGLHANEGDKSLYYSTEGDIDAHDGGELDHQNPSKDGDVH